MRMNKKISPSEMMEISNKNFLTLEDCEKIMADTNGDIYIDKCSGVSSLPDDLIVKGSLVVQSKEMTELPNGLVVHGNLDISGTKIKKIPDGIVVHGNLDVSGTLIRCIPKGCVGGNLNASYTNIRTIPAGISIGGDLILRKTKVHRLNISKVVGSLDIRATPIDHLPDGFEVGGSIDASYSSLKDIPSSMTHIKGDLIIDHCHITSLPDGLVVHGDLNAIGSKLQTLPVGMSVRGCVDIRFTQVHHIPDCVVIGGVLHTNIIPTFGKKVMIYSGISFDEYIDNLKVSRVNDEDYSTACRLLRALKVDDQSLLLRDDTIVKYLRVGWKQPIAVDPPIDDYKED